MLHQVNQDFFWDIFTWTNYTRYTELGEGMYSKNKKSAILLGKILGWEVRFICPPFLLSGNSKICTKFKQTHKTVQMNIQCTHKLNNTSIFLITNSPSTTLPKITTVNVNTDFPIIT